MKYTVQQRRQLGEAFDYLHGRDAMRHVFLPAPSGAGVRRRGPRNGRAPRRPGAAHAVGYGPRGSAPASMAVGFAGLGIIGALAGISVGLGLWAVAKMSRLLFGKVRRPQYYPRERSRREQLARERRRVRDRFTTGGRPEPEKLLAQYAKAKTGAREALVFGSMLCDLEAYCDNSLLRNADGEIAGRNPGMKGWMRDNCPELLAHYKNALRYKGLAEKFRQAAGAADPVPAAALVAEDDGEVRRLLAGREVREITVRMRKTNGPRGGKTVSGTYVLNAGMLGAARKRALEILDECEGGDTARLRCGTGTQAKSEGNGCEGKQVTRLRCGKARGGVARLERILDGRLEDVPEVARAVARWRVGGKTARGDGAGGGGLASA